MIKGSDNIHAAIEKMAAAQAEAELEKIALFGLTKKVPKLSANALDAIRKGMLKKDPKAMAMGARLGLKQPKKVSAFRFQGVRTPGGVAPPGGLQFRATG